MYVKATAPSASSPSLSCAPPADSRPATQLGSFTSQDFVIFAQMRHLRDIFWVISCGKM